MSLAGLTLDDVPMLMLHQAHKQIVIFVGEAAGFDEPKIPYEAFENMATIIRLHR